MVAAGEGGDGVGFFDEGEGRDGGVNGEGDGGSRESGHCGVWGGEGVRGWGVI